MSSKIIIGIDNGVSGTIGIIYDRKTIFVETPIKSCVNYQKKAKNINRIDFESLHDLIFSYSNLCGYEVKAFLERPMVNPTRFEATASALRSFEATLICLEQLSISHEFIDSKQWQKEMLPSGLKGSGQQKKASMDIGIRLFPQFKNEIEKHEDADGLLIAEWARRNNL